MAFHQAEARLQLYCFESIYSVRGAVGFLLRDKLSFSHPSSGADMIFQAQASPRYHPKLQTETPSTVLVVGLLPLCSLLDGHFGSEWRYGPTPFSSPPCIRAGTLLGGWTLALVSFVKIKVGAGRFLPLVGWENLAICGCECECECSYYALSSVVWWYPYVHSFFSYY